MDEIKEVKDIEVKAEVIKPKKIRRSKVIKPKYNTKQYKLEKDVIIGEKTIKKGSNYSLTEEGAKYFKKQFYIK